MLEYSNCLIKLENWILNYSLTRELFVMLEKYTIRARMANRNIQSVAQFARKVHFRIIIQTILAQFKASLMFKS